MNQLSSRTKNHAQFVISIFFRLFESNIKQETDPLEISDEDQEICIKRKFDINTDHCYYSKDPAKSAEINYQELLKKGRNYIYNQNDKVDFFANNEIQFDIQEEVEISEEVTEEVQKNDAKILHLETEVALLRNEVKMITEKNLQKVAVLESEVNKITEENIQLNSVIVRVRHVLSNISNESDEFV